MAEPVVGMLWPTAENFDRFRAVCVDEQEKTAEAWHARASRKIDQLAPTGLRVVKLDFDPDILAAWCKERGAAVDSHARQMYAAQLMAERRGI